MGKVRYEACLIGPRSQSESNIDSLAANFDCYLSASARMVIGSVAPTGSSGTYDAFDSICEFKKDSIDLVEACKHSYDVGTWIGVTLR